MRDFPHIQTVQPRDDPGMSRAREFAATFSHEIKSPWLPVYLICSGERPFAFFQMLPMVVCSPAFSTDPALCTPRLLAQAANLMTEMSMYAHGAAVVEVPDAETRFTPEIMQKLGYQSRSTRLYQKG